MPIISINGQEIEVSAGLTVIQACEIAGIEIPRFCYHERLAIAGNCRMCLVEVAGGPPKPVASCAMPVVDKMQIFTDTPMVRKAREGVMEFLLANHPLDCPICDQGGECDLQDQAYLYGKKKSEFSEQKRAVCEKNMGPLIKTQMTRCIHCTRCIRFIEDVAGTYEIGAVARGEEMQITTYLQKNITSELSGNVIDLCPVGALTSKPYAFKARSWELKKTESIDVMDAMGCNIRIDCRGLEVMRILPRINEEINEEWISDKTRFCYDGLKYQRLDKPYVKHDGRHNSTSFDEAYKAISKKFAEISSNQIACLTGQLSAAEEIFALKKLFEKIGCKNYDCRIFGEKFSGLNPLESRFNSKIAGIDEADFCLLIAANPRLDAPVLNARIRKKWLQKNLKIAALGIECDLTYSYENLGSDLSILQQILEEKHPISSALKQAKRPMLVLGYDAVCHEEGEQIIELIKKISQKFNVVSEEWNGFNFLARNSGLVNGLELGFVGDLNAKKIIAKAKSGEIKMLILHEVDDGIDFEALKDVFVVYIGSHGDNGAKVAKVILPGLAFSEKEATYLNLEGRSQLTRKAVFGPNLARNNSEIILELAKNLGISLGFEDLSGLKNAIRSEFKSTADIDSISKISFEEFFKPTFEADFSSLEGKSLKYQNYDFYLTNPIARASRTLNRCSAELKNIQPES